MRSSHFLSVHLGADGKSLFFRCPVIWRPSTSSCYACFRPTADAGILQVLLCSPVCCCSPSEIYFFFLEFVIFLFFGGGGGLVHSMGLMYGILWCWWQWTPGWLDVLAVQLVLSVGSCPVPATGSKSPTTSPPPPHIFRLLSIFVCLYLCLLHFLFASRLFSVCLLFRLKIAFFFKYT